jgi:hypothetical protein
MGWMIGGFESRQRLGIFLFTTAIRPALGPTMGTRGSFRGVKRLGRESDYSPRPNSEIKSALSYTSTPQYASMLSWSFKAQGELLPTSSGACCSVIFRLHCVLVDQCFIFDPLRPILCFILSQSVSISFCHHFVPFCVLCDCFAACNPKTVVYSSVLMFKTS